jgi:hypothetical protein
LSIDLHALQRHHPAPRKAFSNPTNGESRCHRAVPLKKPLDEALVGITASQEWRQVEDGYFGAKQ